VSNPQETPFVRTFATLVCITLITVLGGCSQSDQQTAKQREEEAKLKARQGAERLNQDAKKLGQEVKEHARALNHEIGNALNSTAPATNGTSGAQEKLARGSQDLRVEAGKAGVKLDRAALVAKVKTKLATDVGLATVTGVDVDTTGQVVTLRGTVDSVQQKQMAEQAALQVNGVTRVINDLQVRP
jgi:osmotically-inducible protein OsmY